MANFLNGVIDRFENKMAIIKLDDGQQLLWPAAKLPAGIKESSIVKISLTSNQAEEKNRKNLAKDLLNEILQVRDK